MAMEKTVLKKYSAENDPIRIAQTLGRYAEATKSWGLTIKEHAALLDVPTATYFRIRNRSYKGRLSQDKVTRISYIHAISHAMDIAGLPALWLFSYNTSHEYNGMSPLQKVLDGGIISMHDVLKALCIQIEVQGRIATPREVVDPELGFEA